MLFRRQHKLGVFFSALAVVGFLSLGSPIIVSELSYRLSRSNQIQGVQVIGQRKTFGDLLLNDPFTITIPKIGLTAGILPNVNPADESDYLPALKTGVAHAQGSYFPGGGELIYLFAHSTDYAFNIKSFNALFYNLKELEKGDRITLDYHGRSFNYQVEEKKIVAADDLSDLKNLGQERIVLQTCWPPGTTWKRLLIIAYPV
ncbi:MAG: Sortase [Candidatus Amesbacteria bacterium GW2011_GWA2_47_70]|uniref:Sortase n=1 Tax=Candidatus Amesbacteria bacterium GW2011_GWC2_45_19 TaxID=1618366 RepID=A0A0G1M0F1_9BACT|nr:MAG: Sortase [Candidatus Amesbacteria bacterium GW2011_GWC2_45_19]KKU36923.1 MAG: Sortase [Candidatus Amesbacteria bacterium GW2011_GWA1_46_35]KKU68103.1 MAG: sortase family protein [Microgenomates group bacterium GW2011_GWC1_47_20]KKU78399.1 MAG: Sortase [Candidatus Amesbacteria bacterium GW2011_GWA2_47_70]